MRRMIASAISIAACATLLVAMQSCSVRKPITGQRPQPAEGSLVLPPDFLDNYNVPHDAPQGADATISELGQFAWREFIALCWPATIPSATDQTRARPDRSKVFTVTDPQLLVWETYYHKAEMFPAQGETPVPPADFDTYPPVYKYLATKQIRPKDPENEMRTQWNNLDETNEIDQTTLYAHSDANELNQDFRILYEAKVNRVFYDYITEELLYAEDVRETVVRTGKPRPFGTFDLLRYGSSSDTSEKILESGTNFKLVQFPAGFIGSKKEGAIEVKPAWRRLTEEEKDSGRFYMNTVQFYEEAEVGGENVLQVKNDTYGLIALHIIQKTRSFPSFVYATWEQVDNASSGLRYDNLISDDGGEFPVERQHGIPSAINAVNVAVHRLIEAQNKDSVWQYYRLIGVQPNATNPPGPDATQDEISIFNLANLVVETNRQLQSFSGALNPRLNRNLPRLNTFRLGESFNAGGCLGCHGAQGQIPGYDFSVIAAKGPMGTLEPQTINMKKEAMIEGMRALLELSEPGANQE